MFFLQGEDRYDFDNPNPFAGDEEEQEVASVGYRSVNIAEISSTVE